MSSTNVSKGELQQDSFANKKSKPSTDEYLNASLEDIVDRLNNNPNSCESEAEVASAVITVRHAKIIERLNERLLFFTKIAAIATAATVFVPFVLASCEAQRLQADIIRMKKAAFGLNAEIKLLKQDVQKLKDSQSMVYRQLKIPVQHSTNLPSPRMNKP